MGVLSSALWYLLVTSGALQAAAPHLLEAASHLPEGWTRVQMHREVGELELLKHPPPWATCGHRGAALGVRLGAPRADLNLRVQRGWPGPCSTQGWPCREAAHRQPLGADALA